MSARRLVAIKAELAELIPEGEAIIFSREGYSVEQLRSLEHERDALAAELERVKAAAATFADNWRGVPVGPDTFGQTLAALRAALAAAEGTE